MVLVGLSDNNNCVKVIKLYYLVKDGEYILYRDYGKFGTQLHTKILKRFSYKTGSPTVVINKMLIDLKKHFIKSGFINYELIAHEPYETINKTKLLLLLREYFHISNSFQPMKPIDYVKISNAFLDKDWYACKLVYGNRCFVYLSDSKIKIIDNNGVVNNNIIENNDKLLQLLKDNDCIKLDCILSNGILYIYDIIDCHSNFESRKELLDTLYFKYFYSLNDEEQINTDVVFMQYHLVNGYFGLLKLLNKINKTSQLKIKYLIAKRPDKEYKMLGHDKRMILFYEELNN